MCPWLVFLSGVTGHNHAKGTPGFEPRLGLEVVVFRPNSMGASSRVREALSSVLAHLIFGNLRDLSKCAHTFFFASIPAALYPMFAYSNRVLDPLQLPDHKHGAAASHVSTLY